MTLPALPKDLALHTEVSPVRIALLSRIRLVWLLLISCLIAGPLSAGQFGNFTYTSNGSEITITGYTDYSFAPVAVTIPETIEELPVTAIGFSAFALYGRNITSISLPSGLRNLDATLFNFCDRLEDFSVAAANPQLASMGGVLFNKSGSLLIRYPVGKTGSYTVPAGVVGLGVSSFANCSLASGISFPASLTSIGASALSGCEGLTTVTIPAGVTTIGLRAFGYAADLTEIAVDPGNPNYSSLGGVLFNKDQTTLIQYPSGKAGAYVVPPAVTTIGDSAFTNCYKLTGVTIPNGVTSIGIYAFWNCYKITSFAIPASATIIEETAFGAIWDLQGISVDPSNSAYASVDGVLFDKGLTRLMQYPAARPGEYIIPPGVTRIGSHAVRGADGLTTIVLPAGIDSIGTYAFDSCSNLASVTFPTGLASIEASAFASCPKLGSVTFLGNAPAMGSSVFKEARVGFTIYYDNTRTGFTSPTWQGYLAIAIQDIVPLAEAVDAPELVFTTGGAAPWRGQKLVSQDGVDAARSGAVNFSEDSWMETTVVGPGAVEFFWSMSSSPSDVLIFYVDGVLQGGSLSGTVPWQKRSHIFPEGSHTLRWRFRKGSYDSSGEHAGLVDGVRWIVADPVDLTHTTEGGSITITGYTGSASAVFIPATIEGLPVRKIGELAFAGENLTSVYLPEGITTIGADAFRGLDLTEFRIPASVTDIGPGAFAHCRYIQSFSVVDTSAAYSSLDGVLFDKNRTTLIQYSLAKAGSYTIPAGVVTIGEESFSGGSQPTSVSIPSSVLTIGSDAFYKAAGMTSISVSSGNTAFRGLGGVLFNKSGSTLLVCPAGKARSYSMPSGVTKLARNCFAFCELLTSVYVREGVTEIGESAFHRCLMLREIELPSTVALIDETAFSQCSGLYEIHVATGGVAYASLDGILFSADLTVLVQYPGARTGTYEIPYRTTHIGNRAFQNSALSGIVFPSSVTHIGTAAFRDSKNLARATFLGAAPVIAVGAEAFSQVAENFTIRYRPGAAGFTSPLWNGYATEVLPAEPDLQMQGPVFNWNGSVTLTWPAPVGVSDPATLSDIVQRSSSPGNWETIPAPALSISGGMVSFTDSAPLPEKGFYRVGRW